MGEGKPACVQEVSGEPGQVRAAIQRVARERVPDEGEVGSDLVHHPGGNLDFEQRESALALDGLKPGHGWTGSVLLRVGRIARSLHPAGIARVVQQGKGDLPAGVDLAGDQREVAFLHRARAELCPEHGVRRVGAGREEQPRRVGVQSMDQASFPRSRSDARQLRKAAHQGVRRRPRFAGPEGVRRHAGRLVGDHQARVGVDDPDRQVGLRDRLIGRRLFHRDPRARCHRRSLGRALAAHADAAFGDPLHRPTARDAEELGHRLVQPFGGRVRGDHALVELQRAHVRAARTWSDAQEATA